MRAVSGTAVVSFAMASAMSAFLYMSNQPISLPGATAWASCLLANQRGVIQSEERSRDTPAVRSFLAQLQLLFAGHETTTHHLANGLLALFGLVFTPIFYVIVRNLADGKGKAVPLERRDAGGSTHRKSRRRTAARGNRGIARAIPGDAGVAGHRRP